MNCTALHNRIRRQLLSNLLPTALSLAGTAASAACQLEQMQIPVHIVDHRPIATLTLNGTEVPMLVDSGAFFSFLSESTAAQLNLPLHKLPDGLRIEGYTGRVDARQTRVAKVGLLGAELNNVDFIVGGNELNAGIMGVLGRNILAAGDAEYDLAHGAVKLTFPKGDCDKTNFAYWAGEAPVVVVPLSWGLNSGDTGIRTTVIINGERTQALFDTGAPRTALTLRAARRAGIEERDLTPFGRVGGAGEGRVQSWTGLVASFELGGEKILNNRLEIDDNDRADHGMLLGLDYFLAHRIYVSRLQQQIYVTWNGGPVFAMSREAPGKYDAQYAALPQAIANDDADALARRGAAEIASGDLDHALEDLNRACQLAPGMATCFFDRARLRLMKHQPRPALADLDEALRLAPTLAEARYRRAELRKGLGDQPGALADLQELDATLPPAAPLRADMAQLYAGFDQAPEALRQFKLWVDSHPNDARRADVLNNRCWLRTRFNIDLPLALRDCEDAVDLDEDSAANRDSLGWTHLRMGDAAKARKAFDSAIKLGPRPFSLYGRALARRRLNDTAGSELDLVAARKLRASIDADVRKQGFEFADMPGGIDGSQTR